MPKSNLPLTVGEVARFLVRRERILRRTVLRTVTQAELDAYKVERASMMERLR